jgi:ATP-dependent Clp protease ATP-binding subunit ClpA
LLGYNNGQKILSSPVVSVLGNMKGIQKGFSVFDLCEELVNVLPMTPLLDSSNTNVKETVIVGGKGSGGSTNTLSEVGVDLTQLALEGKLDPVYGRNSEIRSALRTLGRRRKNNPCLVGDPGN